jgi:carbon-monoxide dehydrogenase small subunit
MVAVQTPSKTAPIANVVRARSETEAAWILADASSDTRPIAGGTDLMLHIDRGKVAPRSLVDIRRAGMDKLVFSEKALHIGSTATAGTLSRWSRLKEHAAGLWEAAATLSVPQVRNLATVGGNLANASPAADMVPPILAMGGTCEIRKGDHVRRLPADQLATGPGRTVLQHDELITNIILPRWRDDAFHWFCKLGFRDAQVIAVTSLAFSCELEGGVVRRVGIALGSVAPRVVRAKTVEEHLVGEKLTQAVAREAMALLKHDISPISDQRSRGDFRLKVAQNYLGDALARAYLKSQGKDHGPGALPVLKDPAPRPPAKQAERTDVLGDLGVEPAKPPKVVKSGKLSYEGRPAPKKKASKKKASKKKASKKKASKKKASKTIDVRAPIQPVRFNLNGREVELPAHAGSRLLDVLREQGQLTGVKEGCGEGECGACTVLLDGQVACACLLLAQTVEGCDVTTVEGLTDHNTGEPHPVQRHFVAEMGTQCGFCTPGMVLSAVATLAENPQADRAEILDGISGTLCRCTGYTRIVRAVEKARDELNGNDRQR